MEGTDEIVHEFLVESHENLDQLDSDLVALEGAPGSRDLLGSIFRTIHTIKGTSGFLAFHALERVTHAGENLLVDLRDGKRRMDQATTDVLLRMVDAVRAILATIEADGTEGDVPVDDVVTAINALMEAAEPGVASQPAAPAEPPAPAEPAPKPKRVIRAKKPKADAPPRPANDQAKNPTPDAPAPTPAADVAPDEPFVPVMLTQNADSPTLDPVRRTQNPVRPTQDAVVPTPRGTTDRPLPARPAPVPAASLPAETTDPDPDLADEPTRSAPAARSAADSSIRVDVDLLDDLMRQVGELVLARNGITRLAEGNADLELVRASQRLSLIASELQEGVMKTRMQPIEHVWSKVPRMIRDLSGAAKKQVRLEMTGGDTELDRSLLEAIKDPLTHLIRNAIDHGIEPPEGRMAAGKYAVGVVGLRAYHQSGQVVVEVSDDGKGIDPETIADKAVERGLRTERQVAGMAPADLLQLLFLPGFSTAAAVTNVSGRGVGMDVVRTKIEAIGGTVDVESTPGRGAVWRLRIPLTLAIMPAVSIECDGQSYEIPQVSLLELVAPGAQSGTAIEYVRSAPVYRLRGDLLPLVDLREVFGAQPRPDGDGMVIAVLHADGQRFGLVVDRVLNTEEIVVKPLSARLKTIGLYAGATLLGDGRVSLILDIQAIGRRCMRGESGQVADQDRGRRPSTVIERRETEQVLIAGIGQGRRVAVPLTAVTRLEKLPASIVEMVGGREVVQYRGSITPLVRLDQLLGSTLPDGDELTVVVSTRGTRSVAVVVEEIVDIVDDDVAQHSDHGADGLLGSTVLNDRVTELLDVRAAIASADPDFYAELTEDDANGATTVPFDEDAVHALAGLADAAMRGAFSGGS